MMDSPIATPAGPGELLERARELATLAERLDAVCQDGGGHVVLVAGEAGVGKTTLLRSFCAAAPDDARVLWGACDSLFTPQPLGPLLDIAETTGGELAELVAGGAKPHAIGTALLHELTRSAPSLLVIEDLHWADEASLDVFRVVARRIGNAPVLLLASYRDDGIGRGDPLRIALGELATAERVSRMSVSPLSPDAVAQLAARSGIDGDELYRVTGGNAFFVSEVLAATDNDLPVTVRDAVLARAARLSPAARHLLETAAVIPPPVDLALLSALVPDGDDALDECLAAGMLMPAPAGVAFRHELARIAVEQSLAASARRAFHARALEALIAARSPGGDVARLAHHAEGADDADAVLRFAPEAAVEAATVGAHHEAAAQYERALRFSGDAPLAVRGDLLSRRAEECGLIDEFSEAIELGRQALECSRAAGDRRAEARALQAMAWPLWNLGRAREAEASALQAVALLEQFGPSQELIAAYRDLSTVRWAAGASGEAVEWGEKGLELAERLGDRGGAIAALVCIGIARLWSGAPGADREFAETCELARREGAPRSVASAYAHLTGFALHTGAYGRAESYVAAGTEYCTHHDLDSYRPYLVALGAEIELAQGRWGDAAASSATVLAREGIGPATISALSTLGSLRARRGDPGVWDALDRALDLAEPSGEIWRIDSVVVARAEAAWLEGRDDAVIEETERGFELAKRAGTPWTVGQLALWRRRAGLDDDVDGVAEPFATQLNGDWKSAAAQWRELGCRYDAALALGDADDDDALREALIELQDMGATQAAAGVARRLRRRGVKGLPRGPRAGTRDNPAQMTARELEVLALVVDGLRNAEIAARLFVSQKTVAHHVSAILGKLEVRTRGEAAAAAVRLGLARPR